MKKVSLKILQNSQEDTCDRVFFLNTFKNIFFTEYLWATASVYISFHIILINQSLR